MLRLRAIKSYLGYFKRRLRTDPYIIANWRVINDDCVVAESLFEPFLVKMASEDRDIVFVQVGANSGDGKHDVYDIIKRWNIRAVLIEPQPEEFLQLRKNYGDLPRVKLVNMALGEEDEVRRLYRLSSLANTFHVDGKQFGSGIASFDRNHVVKYYMDNVTREGREQDLEGILEILEVPCRTFEGLMSDLGIRHIDILMIDTEGYDYEILKMVAASSFSPGLIRYEHKHLGGKKVDSWRLLNNLSYKIIVDNVNGDSIAIKNEIL